MNLPKSVFWEKVKAKCTFWQYLNTSQKISFGLFIFLLLIIPLAALASLSVTVLRQRATEPITPPVIITPTPAEVCPSDHPCKRIYYGHVYIKGTPAPIGTKVRMYSPRNELVGCGTVGGGTVSQEGVLPFTRVYGSEAGFFFGMQSNEPVTFKVNGQTARTEPSPIIWKCDGVETQIDIFLETPSPTPTAHIECIKGPRSFTVNGFCLSGQNELGFPYSNYVCQDGYKRTEGSDTSCKDINTWFQYAKSICQQRGCLPTPPPFTPPPLTPKPTLTACQKNGGVCCKGPTEDHCTNRKFYPGVNPENSTQGGCSPSGTLPFSNFCCARCK